MDIIVLDFGSRTFRSGYAHSFPSEEDPRACTPNLVEDHSCSPPVLRRPIQHGEVADLDALESLIHHSLYHTLGWEIGHEGAVVASEPLLMNKRARELLAQLFFEVFNLDGLFMQDSASLSLYGMGKLTGTVVDVGHGKIDVATVTDGQVNPASIRRMPFAGEEMTEYLSLLTSHLGSSGTSQLTPAQVESLKEACATVAGSSAEYQQLCGGTGTAQETTWELPDGQRVTTTTQGYQVGEALMDPSVLGPLPPSASPRLQAWAQSPGLAHVVAECVASTSQLDLINKRSGHVKDVFVCGGGALMPGLAQRLVHDLKEQCPPEPTPALTAIPEYIPAAHGAQHAAWLGGAVLGRVIAGQSHWVTRWDYDECGPTIVGRKCA